MEQRGKPSILDLQRSEDTEAVPDLHSGLPNVAVKMEREDDAPWIASHQAFEESRAFPGAHSGFPEEMTKMKDEEGFWDHQTEERNRVFPTTCSEFPDVKPDLVIQHKQGERAWIQEQKISGKNVVPEHTSEFPVEKVKVEEEEEPLVSDVQDYEKGLPGGIVKVEPEEEPWVSDLQAEEMATTSGAQSAEELTVQGSSQSFEPEATQHALEELQSIFQEEESEEDFLGFPEDSTGDEESDQRSWNQPEGSSSQESSDEESSLSEDPGEGSEMEYVSRNTKEIWKKTPSPSVEPPCPSVKLLRPGLTTFAVQRLTNQLRSSLQLFLTAAVMNHLVHFTNKFGGEVFGQHWSLLSEDELWAYLGLRILAGAFRSAGENMEDLWSPVHGRPHFKATMSVATFKKINRVLRFDDRQKRRRINSSDKLAPVRDFLALFKDTLAKPIIPGESVTVGEQSVAFRGRCPIMQYMPSKPAKYGIKFWMCCDSRTSYVYNMDICSGRAEGAPAAQSLEQRVVLQLTEDLHGSGRNVTADHCFTSTALARELGKNKMTLVGALRTQNPEIPLEFLPNKKRTILSSIFGFQDNLTLVSYVPKKGKAVILLSSMHNSATISGPKSEPEIIMYYNKTKGGVDTCDQMISIFSSQRMVHRWPMVVFSNILDIACLNAYIVWKENNPGWGQKKSSPRRLFLIELGLELIKPWIQTRNIEHLPLGSRRAAMELLGVSTSEKKRGRCHLCDRKTDCKTKKKCIQCARFVCAQHAVLVCHTCM